MTVDDARRPASSGVLRPIVPADHADVLALNHANVELLAPMDESRLGQLLAWADLAHVVEHEGGFAGFVITVAAGSAYDSANYRWFAERYEDYYYLDRIVLAEHARRRGLGGRVYDEIEARARSHRRMCLEVNVEPPNLPSLAFHDRRGYREVGRLGEPGHLVTLRALEFSGRPAPPGRAGSARRAGTPSGSAGPARRGRAGGA